MKEGILKVVFNIVILLVILAFFDIVIGCIAEKYMKWLNNNPRKSDAALINYDLNAATPDVAIIGSSTAICHYDPDILHDSLCLYTGKDLEVFNMGMSRQRMAYNYYGLKCLVDRKIPKVVIADVWASNVSESDISKGFVEYRPYVKINKNVEELLQKHNEYDFKLTSNMYCLNTEFIKLLMAFFKPKNANGHQASDSEMQSFVIQTEKDTSRLAKISVGEFDAMIDLSKKYNFQLFVVLSPTLHSSDTTSLSYKYMKEKCKKEGVPFLDYSHDTLYMNVHYYRDITHMNKYGAELFSQNLMVDIKDIVK